jgi:uncharacterized protein with PQ loop repeat
MKLAMKIAAGAGLGALFAAMPALAQAPAAAAVPVVPTDAMVNKGDVSWMLVSSALVLMMSVPGLALFYGGLVRTKNMLSVLMQVLTIVCVAGLLWVTIGYSMAFTNGDALGLNWFVGGFSKALMHGVDANTFAATFSNGVYLPETTFVVCLAAVGGLVRLQRRLRTGSQRLCRAGLHQHLGATAAAVLAWSVGEALPAQGQGFDAGCRFRAPSPAWWPSRPPPATSVSMGARHRPSWPASPASGA